MWPSAPNQFTERWYWYSVLHDTEPRFASPVVYTRYHCCANRPRGLRVRVMISVGIWQPHEVVAELVRVFFFGAANTKVWNIKLKIASVSPREMDTRQSPPMPSPQN